MILRELRMDSWQSRRKNPLKKAEIFQPMPEVEQ